MVNDWQKRLPNKNCKIKVNYPNSYVFYKKLLFYRWFQDDYCETFSIKCKSFAVNN